MVVFNSENKKILVEPTELVTDQGEINFYDCEDKTFVLFSAIDGGQGAVYGSAVLLEPKDKKFEKVWSLGLDLDKERYNENTIVEPGKNKIAIYEYQTIQPDFKCPTKCLFEFLIPPGNTSVLPSYAFIYSYDMLWNTNTCRFEKDETVDWPTYRNEEYGFEMKYPINWTKKEIGVEAYYTEYQGESNEDCMPEFAYEFRSSAPPQELYLIVLANPHNDSIIKWIQHCNGPFLSINYEDFKIGDEKALKAIITENDIDAEKAIIVSITKKEKLFMLAYMPGEIADVDNTVNQMISTFRFID